MKRQIEKVKSAVRGIMFEVAKLLDELSNGFIKPNHVTFLSLAGHVFILLAITQEQFVEAAVMLIGFGLLDALDGALAKYQKTASNEGMLLDSVTDRLKETLIFAGLTYYFAEQAEPLAAMLTVLALGVSFAVSYVKAKGEVAVLEQKKSHKNINREFEDGIFGYEVRMFVLVVALFAQQPLIGVYIVGIGSLITFLMRFSSISRKLK